MLACNHGDEDVIRLQSKAGGADHDEDHSDAPDLVNKMFPRNDIA